MKKTKAAAVVFAALMLCISACGCWDYKGMDEITFITGFALDIGENNETYKLSLEITDMTGVATDGAPTPEIIAVEGQSLSEAVHRTREMFYNNAYFGNAEVFIISNKIIDKFGLLAVIDPLMRNFFIRDTMTILISREHDAGEMLISSKEQKFVSLSLNETIIYDRHGASVSKPMEIFQMYDALEKGATSLAMPAIGYNKEDHDQIILDGVALFDGDKIKKYLEEDKVQTYLMAIADMENGTYVYQDDENKVTSKIETSQSSLDYDFDGKKFTFKVNIDMSTSIIEVYPPFGSAVTNAEKIEKHEKMQKAIEKAIEEDIFKLITDSISEGIPDYFGFANLVYSHDYSTWNIIKDSWGQYYAAADFQVNCHDNILDSGIINRF